MKKILITTVALAGFAAFANAATSAAPQLKTQMDKVSYSVGYDIGKGFKMQSLGIQKDQFESGFESGLSGATPAMTEESMHATLTGFQKEMMKQAMQKQQAAAATNMKASEAYLKKVSAMSGVVQLEPGLYYKVLKTGHGKMPTAQDTVTVNYEGTLPDGTVFDSSYKRGQPASFPVGQVIPGWTKVLQKMPVGSTWMVYMSPELAYGTAAPPQIGPNQALTFKIELLSIKPKSSK